MKLNNAFFLLLLFMFMPKVWALCEDVDDYTEINGDYNLAENDSSSASIYAMGSATTGSSSTVKGALCAIDSVSIGKYATVQTLIDSSSSVTLAEGAKVENGSITAIGEVSLAKYVTVGESIISESSVTLGESSKVEEDITATGEVSLAKYVTVGKSIISESSVTLGESSKVEGYISATGEVSLAKYVTVGESIISESSVTLGESSKVEEGITATGEVSLDKYVIVGESITSENSVTLGESSKVEGYISATGEVSLAKDVTVGESITSESLVTLGKNVKVEGDISAESSVILGQNTTVKGNISTNGSITLEKNAKVESNISANGLVILGQNVTVEGDISTNSSVTLGKNAKVTGDICAKEGVIWGVNATVEGTITTGELCVEVYSYSLLINTSADALTCEAHLVTINVINNDDNSLLTDYQGEITLSADSTLATWVLSSGKGDFLSSGNGEVTYQFDVDDQGSAIFLLSYQVADKLIVSVTDQTESAEPETITFHSALIKTELQCTKTIDSHCINIANQAFKLTLTALKETDESTVCESYNPSGIKFWSEYEQPILPVGETSVEVKLESMLNFDPIGKTELTATELAVVFSDGEASVKVNYPDAGQIKIHLQDADITEITGVIETIVNPYQLVIDNITEHQRDLEEDRAKSDQAFIRASVPNYDDLKVDTFDLTVKAIIDCSTTGELANCPSGLSSYEIAASFSNELTLIPSQIGDDELGNLSYEDSLEVLLEDGAFTYQDLAYSEAGILGLQLESHSYLLITGNNISVADIQQVGHFYPDYIAFGGYQLSPACNDDFSYLGQQSATLSYYLSAYNQASSPSVTENYDPTHGYSVAPTANFADYAFAGTTELTSRLLVSDYYNQDNWQKGIYQVDSEMIGIERIINTPDGPYLIDNNVAEYWVELIGDDGEKINASSDCSESRCLLGNLGDLVYGRLQAGNGHGSEFQPIRTLIEASYFDGEHFTPLERDICTTIIAAQVKTESISGTENDITALTTNSITNSPFIQGQSYLEFSEPDVRGKLNYFVRLKDLVNTSLYAPWLLDSGNAVTCADETGTLSDCISGHVEFGLFRGNDRIIYRMQTFD